MAPDRSIPLGTPAGGRAGARREYPLWHPGLCARLHKVFSSSHRIDDADDAYDVNDDLDADDDADDADESDDDEDEGEDD